MQDLQKVFSDINQLMTGSQDEVFLKKYATYLKEAKAIINKNDSDPMIDTYTQQYTQYEMRYEYFKASVSESKKQGGLKSFGRKVMGSTPFGGPEKYSDNGISNDVHQSNLGKLRFGEYEYHGTPAFTTESSFSEPPNYHLFLPASVVNLAQKEGKSKGDRRWYAVTSNSIQFIVHANGEKQFEWLEVSPDGPVPDTYYSGESITKKRRRSLIEPLKQGINTIRIEAFLYNNTIRETHKRKVAEGSFEIRVEEEEFNELKKELIPKRNVVSPVTIYNGLNQTIKVQSTNLETDAYESDKIGPLQQKVFYFHSENGSGIRISYASSSRLIKHIPMDQVPFDIIRVP